AQTATLGREKAEGWDFEHFSGGHSSEPPMQNRVPGVRRNADGTPIRSIVGFRPLFGSCVASTVHGLLPETRCLVFTRLLTYSVFCYTSVSQQQFTDTSCDSPVCRRCCWFFK
ncbi:hypothetical protein HAX54_001992, partial [Datura stramonium]|nr:hypothetical protein [Datura stramonium]